MSMNIGELGRIAGVGAGFAASLTVISGVVGRPISGLSRRTRNHLRRRDIRENLALIQGLKDQGIPSEYEEVTQLLWKEIDRDARRLSTSTRNVTVSWKSVRLGFVVTVFAGLMGTTLYAMNKLLFTGNKLSSATTNLNIGPAFGALLVGAAASSLASALVLRQARRSRYAKYMAISKTKVLDDLSEQVG